MTFVVGNRPGTVTITATYQSACEQKTASATIVVPELEPGEFVVQAKFEDCGWNAPYCEFSSPKNKVPLRIRAGISNNGAMEWLPGLNVEISGYIPGTNNYPDVNPPSGITDGNGEFLTEFTPVETIPYMAAYVEVCDEFETFCGDSDVRAISRDFCHGNINPNGSLYGSRTQVVGKLDFPYPIHNLHMSSPKYFAGNLNTKGYCYPPQYLQCGGSSAHQEYIFKWVEFWDTLLIIPADLSLLGNYAKVKALIKGTGSASGSEIGSISSNAGAAYGFGFGFIDGGPLATFKASAGYFTDNPPIDDGVSIPEVHILPLPLKNLIGMPWAVGFLGQVNGGTSIGNTFYGGSSEAFAELSVSWEGIQDVLLLATESSIGPFKCISCSGEKY
jgi:hypothetical protein